jgi:hypothetical protein
MSQINKGDVVNVEGVAVDVEPGVPYGAVTVHFPFCTDPDHELDGVTLIAPAVIVQKSNEFKENAHG